MAGRWGKSYRRLLPHRTGTHTRSPGGAEEMNLASNGNTTETLSLEKHEARNSKYETNSKIEIPMFQTYPIGIFLHSVVPK
jgi:hypothetical protein